MTAIAPIPGLGFIAKTAKTIRNFVTDTQPNLNIVQRANKAYNGIYIDSILVWSDDVAPIINSDTWGDLVDQLKKYDYTVTLGAYEEDTQLVNTNVTPHHRCNAVHRLEQRESSLARQATLKYYQDKLEKFKRVEREAAEAKQKALQEQLRQRQVVRDATFEEASVLAKSLLDNKQAGFVCSVSKLFDNGYRSTWEYDVREDGTITSTRPNGNRAHAIFNDFEEFVEDLDRYYHINDFDIRMA